MSGLFDRMEQKYGIVRKTFTEELYSFKPIRTPEVKPDLDALWEIVKELSEKEPIAVRAGEERCIFCDTKGDLISNLRHKDTCIISRAYKLVWEKENREWHERKSEGKANVKIDRLDGSCPVQAAGTIGDHSAFYFRGRHEQWQFIAGPKELSRDDLIKVQLKFIQDPDVFVLEGDDDERMYQDYEHVRNVLQGYAKQYVEWMDEKGKT